MKITRLEIDNFLAIGHIECNLADKGLVLIQGVNKDDTSQDSNGSGKSSFPDAIMWCLYGATARGEASDAVINRTAGRDCRVLVSIDDGTAVYHVARHRKHKTGKNSLTLEMEDASGAARNLTLGTDALTQQAVLSMLGCSAEVFCAAVYAGQDNMPDLPGSTDKVLKRLVEQGAGIEQLEKAYDLARGHAQRARSAVDLADNTHTSAAAASQRALQTVADVEAQRNAWAENHKIALKQELAAINARKAELAAQAPVDTTSLQIEKGKLAVSLAGLQSEQDRERELRNAVSEAESHLAVSQSRQRMAQTQQVALNKAAQDVASRVGSPCGECGKPYETEDIEEAVTLARGKAELATAAVAATAAALVKANAALTDARDELDLHRSVMTDASAVSARLSAVNDDLMRAQRHNQSLDAAQQALTKRIEDFKRAVKQDNPHAATLVRMGQAARDALKAEGDALIDVVATRDHLVYAEIVVKVYGPAGVRAHILDTVTPFLNQRTADYLGALTDGNIEALWTTLSTTQKGEVREKFSIDVTSRTGAESFGGLSGGEKRKVRLACAMALQDLVASRATKPIELFIADEIDHALDEAGLERLMGVLDTKARDRGTVLVISHNSLQDWIRSAVTVTKENGKATMDAGGAL